MEKRNEYWRSLASLENDSSKKRVLELAEQYPEYAPTQEELNDPVGRRRFIQLMGASVAFAGAATGCRWEKEKIVPLAKRPENYLPGEPKYYATAMEFGGSAYGMIATNHDGRPTKVDGNADHPFTGEADLAERRKADRPHRPSPSSAFAQASILELYDPDRSKNVLRKQGASLDPVSWKVFETKAQEWVSNKNLRLHILSEATSSPTADALYQELRKKLPSTRWYEYEPLGDANERAGMQLAFRAEHGQSPERGTEWGVVPVAQLDRAEVVVTLDADLFEEPGRGLKYARDFGVARGNADNGRMTRFYSVESSFTTVGGAADHRLPIRSEQILPFVAAIRDKIKGRGSALPAFIAEDAAVKTFFDALVGDVKNHRTTTVFVAGQRQPAQVHALAAELNHATDGNCLHYYRRERRMTGTLADLSNAVRRKQVDVLLVLGGNPIYNAPADVDFRRLLAEVPNTVHLSNYVDETSSLCNWHLPRAHFLEAWTDARTPDGRVTIGQPLVRPLYNGRTPIEVLSLLAGTNFKGEDAGEDLVRATYNSLKGGSPADWQTMTGRTRDWRAAVHAGFVDGDRFGYLRRPRLTPTAVQPKIDARANRASVGQGELEVVFTSSSHSYDGRFANNSWLQEAPDPLTKLTWSNAALVARNTARKLGIKNNELIDVTVGGASIRIPAYVMPGQAAGSVAIALGHGRTHAGVVGGSLADDVPPQGVDAYPLRTTAAPFIAAGATVKGTGKTFELVSTQDHWDLDSGGQKETQKRIPWMYHEGRFDEYQEAMNSRDYDAQRDAFHGPPHADWLENKSLWDPPETYDTGHKWGMTIDLNKCIGCNACTIACQSENNIPVVGPDQVKRSREMHWIRTDRYFKGDIDNPEVAMQPVHCQQCENAPCEQVCPAGATVHSDEGLNDMAYNRCVGTRYCGNNCPYVVRRFNFLNYQKEMDYSHNEVKKLLFNPDVTVRSRGVMEKCTWCVQRINRAHIRAEVAGQGHTVRDGDIVTACQQACPTSAIEFGDLNDANSKVAKLHPKDQRARHGTEATKPKNPRGYFLLEEWNTKPRNMFLAKVRNPNPAITPRKKKDHH